MELDFIPSMQSMLEAGSHFGHQATRWNPKMKKYIFLKKDNVHIIDLKKTQDNLIKACKYIRDLVKNNQTILFVGTKKQAVQIVRQQAERVEMPFIVNRWIGGLLTNNAIVGKNIHKLNSLAKDLQSKEFQNKYTKKELAEFQEQHDELFAIYEGVKDMKKLPDAIFVVDAHHEKTAVAEANKKKIPVIALIDTNADPTLMYFPIPANDDSFKSIDIITKTIADAIMNGKKLQK